MASLKGKVAVVNGAGSGIGESCAKLLASRGARVVVATRRKESADKVVAAIQAEGGQAVAASGDIAEEATARDAVARAIDSFGRLDILVNNAAITDVQLLARDSNVAEMDGETWLRTLAVNLVGPAFFCKYAIPAMIKSGGGSVVMVSSGRGTQGDIGLTAYGASKAALINLALNVATQYGKEGIRANSLVVGMVLTDSVRKATAGEMASILLSHHLTPYIGEPIDIAEAIAFLASDEARFITAATLAVDGGITGHTAPYADYRKTQGGDVLSPA